MSQWTHLAGIVRVDSLLFSQPAGRKEEILRQIFLEKIPHGSEGPAYVHVHKEIQLPEESCLRWGTVNICGDLRNFGEEEDVESVKKWFESALSRLTTSLVGFIRNAVLLIEVEYGPVWVGVDTHHDDPSISIQWTKVSNRDL